MLSLYIAPSSPRRHPSVGTQCLLALHRPTSAEEAKPEAPSKDSSNESKDMVKDAEKKSSDAAKAAGEATAQAAEAE